MTVTQRLVAVLAAAAQSGCGLLLANAFNSPEERATLDKYQVDEQPPRVRFLVGEVRDFATYRLEPAAVLEFWSEDLNYLPVATLDGQGRFSVRIDECQRDATVADNVVSGILLGTPNRNCMRWIGRFQVRARFGGRCSLSEPDEAQRSSESPLVLWLRDCQQEGRGDHAWREVPAVRSEKGPREGN